MLKTTTVGSYPRKDKPKDTLRKPTVSEEEALDMVQWAVEDQCKIGLDFITDGESYRENMYWFYQLRLDGLDAKNKIRKDFPILNEKVNGKELVYLDNAATSQKPKEVIDSLVSYYEKYNSNVHRGVHTLSIKATDEFEKSRTKIQKFINAKSSNEIIFTRNASESLNLIAYSWGKNNISSGDEIYITPFEHHSNIVPWQMLCKEKEAILKYLPLNNNGDIDIERFSKEISNKTKLVSVTHMSNVLGTVLPLNEIIELAKKYKAVTVVDACQSVPHMPVDVQKIDSDFLCFSGHKMLGPTGIGVLHGKEEILNEMSPFLYGGDMISEVTYEESKWNELPYKFEAGTPNIADSIALGVACEYLEKVGMENIWNHEMELGDYTVTVSYTHLTLPTKRIV